MANIKDVAKKAGVGISTVSRVINDTKNVSPELRVKVERAIDELGYSTNQIARGLKISQTRNIAVIVTAISRIFFTTILEGINKYLLLLAKEQIRLAFEQSEKEVQDLRQRTKEGMQTARLSGKQIGHASGTKFVTKKSIAAKEIILKHNKTFGGSLNDLETITQAGITRKTFYKYKKELLSEMIEQTNQR